MINDILRVFWINLFLLPGEAGFMALVLYKEDFLNLVSGFCTLGILFTVNSFVIYFWGLIPPIKKGSRTNENKTRDRGRMCSSS